MVLRRKIRSGALTLTWPAAQWAPRLPVCHIRRRRFTQVVGAAPLHRHGPQDDSLHQRCKKNASRWHSQPTLPVSSQPPAFEQQSFTPCSERSCLPPQPWIKMSKEKNSERV